MAAPHFADHPQVGEVSKCKDPRSEKKRRKINKAVFGQSRCSVSDQNKATYSKDVIQSQGRPRESANVMLTHK